MDEALSGAAEPDAYTLLPEGEVRRALASRNLTFTLLAPPYPVAGVGALRVLRVIERDGAADLVAGYDRYERLAPQDGAPAEAAPPGAAPSP